MQETAPWALPLSDSSCTDAALTGGKAAALSRLLAEGLPVPDAFVLPISTFNAHFNTPAAEQRPERPGLSRELMATLEQVHGDLCPSAGDQLVVRSSALDEDGVSASYAGQHATYYYVGREDLGKAVVDCWMSLWSDHALAYRANQPANGVFGMAVIIQRMIQAERSGVCFTADPTGAIADSALLESVWGLGAALVDGRVSPDRFWVDQTGEIVDRKIARKRLKVGEDLRDPAGQRLEPVPLNLQTRATLTDVEVAQIVDVSRQIATSREVHQDVEWAIAGDELFILQNRPITATGQFVPAAMKGRWVLFKPTAENFSEPFTPMTVDLLRRVVPPFGQFIQGRYYINADLLEKLLPWKLDDEALADLLLMRGTVPEHSTGWLRLLRFAGFLSLGYLCGGVGWHRTANIPLERLQSFEQRCRAVVDNDDLNALNALQQLIFNDHPWRPIGEFAVQANISSIRYALLIILLRKLLDRLAPEFDQAKLALICSGGAAMLSHQMVEGIRELADLARADTSLTEAMLADSADLQALVVRLGESHPFAAALKAFMQRFGHRAVRELDLIAPRWQEDHTTVLAMVRNYLDRESAQREQTRVDIHGLLLAAEDELHQALKHRWQRNLVDHLVERIRYYVTLRENTRHYHTMAIATARLKLKQLEQLLIAEGRLRCEDDIFFLEHFEAQALKSGELDWPDVESLVRERRLRYQRLSQQTPADSYNLKRGIPVLQPEKHILVGDCASPGVATGTARIIRDPSVAAELAVGDILVAPYTDPAWTPLFPGAAAIIVEVGSYLSHAGTVAREYQVPCLVDVHNCTRRIRSGQQLRVNATEGWVEILQ